MNKEIVLDVLAGREVDKYANAGMDRTRQLMGTARLSIF